MAAGTKNLANQFGVYTLHDTDIIVNETWLKADGPHFISPSSGNLVTVHSNATLTIEAGCQIFVKDGKGLKISGGTGNHGGIVCNGTDADPIKFFSDSDQYGYRKWSGIQIFSGVANTLPHEFSFVHIFGSGNVFSYAIECFGGKPVDFIHHALFQNNYGAIKASQFSSYNGPVYEYITVDNCDFGIDYHSEVTIRNCIVEGRGNSKRAIVAASTPTGNDDHDYNTVHGTFSSGAYSGTSAGLNSITTDPLFVKINDGINAPPFDYNLQGGSASLTSGDLGQEVGRFGPLITAVTLPNQFNAVIPTETTGVLKSEFGLIINTTDKLPNQFSVSQIDTDIVLYQQFNVFNINTIESLSNQLAVAGEVTILLPQQFTVNGIITDTKLQNQFGVGILGDSVLPNQLFLTIKTEDIQKHQFNISEIKSETILKHEFGVVFSGSSELANQLNVNEIVMYHSGIISANETWFNSIRHVILGEVRVENAELTIEPGVIVDIQEGSLAVGLVIGTGGSLICNGTQGSFIIFDSPIAEPSTQFPSTWVGIKVEAGALDVQLSYVEIHKASTAFDTALGDLNLHHLVITRCNDIGIASIGNNNKFEYVTLQGINTGFFINGAVVNEIRNCIIDDDAGVGFANGLSEGILAINGAFVINSNNNITGLAVTPPGVSVSPVNQEGGFTTSNPPLFVNEFDGINTEPYDWHLQGGSLLLTAGTSSEEIGVYGPSDQAIDIVSSQFRVRPLGTLSHQFSISIIKNLMSQFKVRPLGTIGHQILVLVSKDTRNQFKVVFSGDDFVGNQFKLFVFEKEKWMTMKVRLKSKGNFAIKFGEIALRYKV